MQVVISPIHIENGEYIDGDITLDSNGHVHQYLWMICRFLEDGNFRTVQLEHDEDVIAAPREIINEIVWLHLLTDHERQTELCACTVH
jgi:hypothetical protein